ncbi:reverse transcriptase domain-containing protein [Tanacetum coccineum]
MELKTKLETTTKNHQASIQNLKAKFDRLADKQSARPSGSLPSNTQPIQKGTLLEDQIFAEFDEFMAMNIEENSESDFDKEEIPFEKITFDDYKIKKSLDEPPTDLELKPLPGHLEYTFLEELSFLPVIISSQLTEQKKISLSLRMPFGLCNALATFQRYISAIFHDMIKESVEVFMDDFSVFENSFNNCLNNLDKMLQRCKDSNLFLNGEKCHFMVKEGIVLRHKVSEAGLEVDKAKIDVISKLPPPTNVKGIRSFLVGVVLGQKDGKHFHPIYFTSKTLNAAQQKYTITEKEHMAVVFAFYKFRPYMILSKTIVYIDHSALRHLFKKQDDRPRLIRWILMLQEFDIEIKDKKCTENVTADHLSRIENDETSDNDEINNNFPGETLMEISTRDIPWFADFENYLVGDIMPKVMTYQQKNKFFFDLKNYFWEDPYLFKVCLDGGHYGPTTTTEKVLDSGFYWPTIIKEAHTLVRLCEACQKSRNISKHDEMPLNNIQICEVLDI